jgi:hypothetical protein
LSHSIDCVDTADPDTAADGVDVETVDTGSLDVDVEVDVDDLCLI